MKRFISLILAIMLLSGCAMVQPQPKQYTATFLELFDTVTAMTGLSDSQEAFTANAQAIRDALEVYHQLFDIYNSYDGINNLKTVNDNAGIAPVKVDRKIIDLLLDCKAYYDLTGGLVDVTMGAVLRLWHEARSDGLDDPANAYLPDGTALEEAAKHRGWEYIVIDEAASTVYISDPDVSLDVGAVAKGWAAQQVSTIVPRGMMLSVGGNVCAPGPKDNQGTRWVVGVQNPDGGNEYLHTIYLSSGSVVTSGDYQRYYMVDGKIYHHIIDPATLYPSTHWRSVTIVCDDSGLADALSTALFLLPLEEGKALLERCGAEAMWVDAAGEKYYTPGFEKIIRT